METAVLSEHHVRFRTFELILHTRELPEKGLKLKLQSLPIIVLQVQQANGFHFALLEVPRAPLPHKEARHG